MLLARTRSIRPPRTHSGCPLSLELLEDRTLLDAGPSGPVIDLSSLRVDPGAIDPSHILVRFQPAASPVALPGTQLGQALDAQTNLYEVDLGGGVTVAQAVAAYRADPHVASADPDQMLVESQIPNDPQFPNQWNLQNTGQNNGKPGADIHATAAWDVTTGSRGMVVSVMDTGVDYTHPDLYRNIWINQGEIPASRRVNLVDVDGDGIITFNDLNDARNQGPGKITNLNHNGYIDGGDLLTPMTRDAQGRDTGLGGWADNGDTDADGFVDDLIGWNFSRNNNNPMDDNGHGTRVAGVIGATGNNGTGVAGLNWQVQLMPLKFLNNNGNGSVGQFIPAFNYAVAHGARISNNSWFGAGNNQTLLDAINNARTQGHIFVAAAGNSSANTDTSPEYPASFVLDNIVAVASTDNQDHLAGFSNYGAHSVDLAAPGVNVLSTALGGGYSTLSGTSVSTPQVTGALALVWGLRSDWTYTQVINRVLQTVDPLPALAGKTVTGGRLDVAAAVAGLAPRDTTPPTVVASSAGGAIYDTLDRVVVSFDKKIDARTFTPATVQLFVPGGRAVAATAVQPLDGTQGKSFAVLFPSQAAAGTYVFRLGSAVRDPSGNALTVYQNSFVIRPVLTYSSTGPRAIPDVGTTAAALVVPDSVLIGSLAVRVDVTHPRDEDLKLYLQSPDGVYLALSRGNGGTGQNYQATVFDDSAATPVGSGQAPFAGVYRPEGALALLNGRNAQGTWRLWVQDTATGSIGVITGWSLLITPPVVTYSSSGPRPIPNVGTTASSLTVTDSTHIGTVAVQVDVTHPHDGDLKLFLQAPDGTYLALSRGNGGTGSNYQGTLFDDGASTPIANGQAPFAGVFRPDTPLTLLDGRSAQGTWRLWVTDTATGSVGIINSWSLLITPAVQESSVLVGGLPSGPAPAQAGGQTVDRVFASSAVMAQVSSVLYWPASVGTGLLANPADGGRRRDG